MTTESAQHTALRIKEFLRKPLIGASAKTHPKSSDFAFARPALERALSDALDVPGVVLLVGAFNSGKTTLLDKVLEGKSKGQVFRVDEDTEAGVSAALTKPHHLLHLEEFGPDDCSPALLKKIRRLAREKTLVIMVNRVAECVSWSSLLGQSARTLVVPRTIGSWSHAEIEVRRINRSLGGSDIGKEEMDELLFFCGLQIVYLTKVLGLRLLYRDRVCDPVLVNPGLAYYSDNFSDGLSSIEFDLGMMLKRRSSSVSGGVPSSDPNFMDVHIAEDFRLQSAGFIGTNEIHTLEELFYRDCWQDSSQPLDQVALGKLRTYGFVFDGPDGLQPHVSPLLFWALKRDAYYEIKYPPTED